jgi:hypothetical protein
MRSHNFSTGHFFKNSLTALNWPLFVKGILILIFGQDCQINQFAESLHFRPKLGRLGLFGPVEETSRGPSSPINDRVHGATTRGTIDLLIFRIPAVALVLLPAFMMVVLGCSALFLSKGKSIVSCPFFRGMANRR